MDTTYKVRIWAIQENRRGTSTRPYSTYTVRWKVGTRTWKETFATLALADSYRADLLRSARHGEAFVASTGRPLSMVRTQQRTSWYEFACVYVDMKWPGAAATTRRSTAEALTTATMAMLTSDRGQPPGQLLRTALRRWAFNSNRRNDPTCPDEIKRALQWVERNARPVAHLADPGVLRGVLEALASKLDGRRAAATVVNRKRGPLQCR